MKIKGLRCGKKRMIIFPLFFNLLFANDVTKPIDPEKCHVTENMIPLPPDYIKEGLRCTRSNELNKNGNQYIVGGSVTEKGRYPWQVGLRIDFDESYFCGGSILSDDWVITAAHCCDDVDRINIHVGDWKQYVESDEEFSVVSTEMIIHPGTVLKSMNTIKFIIQVILDSMGLRMIFV